jgi:hypothetical protein
MPRERRRPGLLHARVLSGIASIDRSGGVACCSDADHHAGSASSAYAGAENRGASVANNYESWKSAASEVRVASPAPRLFLHRVVGRYDVPAVRYVFGKLAEQLERVPDSVFVFGDLDVASYDTAIRGEANRFVRAYGQRIAEVHLIASDSLAHATLSVLKLMTRLEMRVHLSRASYEGALGQALQREAPGREAAGAASVAPW